MMFNRRLLLMLPLGFASGLPLPLSSSTVQAWLTVEGVAIATIGLFALTGLPYTLKFLWAPLVDRFVPLPVGRRRAWLLLTQTVLALTLAGLASLDPHNQLLLIAGLALLIAFFSATQDIAFDALRTDVLQPTERGLGAALSVTGYRLAMLVAGAGALILGEHWGWANTFLLMAGLMASTLVVTLLTPEPAGVPAPRSLRDAVVGPLAAFFARPEAWGLILLVVLYKLGDAFAGSLTTAFLIRGAGFTPTDVGLVNKGFGLAATLIGALAGGLWLMRLGLFRALMLFGILQAVTNLGFFALSLSPQHYPLMVVVVGLENLAGGMGTAAFVALLMGLCEVRYSATQFALLSALASLGRVLLGPVAGGVVTWLDWPLFFVLTFLAALPGLWWLNRMRPAVEAAHRNPNAPAGGES
ncbi:MAG: AmpG family muropeptide MFS transporter [Pseudomonadota bacterium]|jgi:PAT family beta-lactamase induction signal transducer AmpG